MSGPFSETELRAGVGSGRFGPGDLVHATGQTDWLPLEQVLGTLKAQSNPATQRTLSSATEVPEWRSIWRSAWARLRRNIVEQGLATGAICLLLGLVGLALSRWPVVFWAPWLVIAGMTGGVLLQRGRKATGAMLLLAVILLPWMLHRYMSKRTGEKVEPVVQSASAEVPLVEDRQPKAPAATTNEPVSAPIVKSSPPAPLPVAPAPVPVQTSPAVPAPAIPATPAPESFLSKAGKLVGSVVPYLKKAKDALPDFSKKSEPADKGAVTSDQDSSTLLEHKSAMVAVKNGPNIVGNGFACRVGTQTWLFSNAHTLAKSKQPIFTLFNDDVLTPGPIEAAAGPDVIRAPLTKVPEHVFEAVPDVASAVQLGDGVMVLGNGRGGEAIAPWRGVVTGIGTDRIELNAPFAPESSGCPILHVKTGKVIGIATDFKRPYDGFTGDAPQNNPALGRHFGYRIDKAMAWQPLNSTEFYAEGDRIEQISVLTGDLFNLYDSLRNQRDPHPANEALHAAVAEWQQKVHRRGMSQADHLQATQSFLNSLRFLAKSDVRALDGHLSYTYFRNQLDSEAKTRERIFQQLEFLLQSAPYK